MRLSSKSEVLWAVVAATMLAGSAAPLAAQSLADVARQEEARRKEISQPAKVYTNKDLVSVPAPTPPALAASPSAPAGDTAGTASADVGKAAAADPKAKDAKDPGAVKDQAYWSKRMSDLTAQLDSDQTLADALRTRIGALMAAPVVGSDLQKASDGLDRLTKVIESDKKALTDFQEEARRASVPPGWLR